MDITIRDAKDRQDIKCAEEFLLKQDLGYPQYEDWVQTAMGEIEQRYKTCLLAYSGGTLVADLVYQPHKELGLFRELKNLRINPIWRMRGLARFMIKQAEVDTDGLMGIVCDVREGETEVIGFLSVLGYQKIAGVSLYDSHAKDIIMVKPLKPEFQPVWDKLIK